MKRLYAFLYGIPTLATCIFAICCLFPALLAAQTQTTCDFQKLFDDGKAAANMEDYETALKKFNSARRCDPDKGQKIDQEIENLYEAINKKKEQAEIEKRRADEEKRRAEEEKRRAEDEKQRAQEEMRKAEAARKIAQAALDSLQKVNADKVRLILAEVQRNQNEMNFNDAVEKLKTARILLALPDSVDLAYKNLTRALLSHAREDLRRMDYKSALTKIKIAEGLNVQPDSVEAASQALQHFLFEHARLDILSTNYDSALEKINVVNTLLPSSDSVKSVWFEIAFCYTETGHPDQAASLLDTIARLNNDPGARAELRDVAGAESRLKARTLRQIMKQLNPELYQRLLELYFPPAFGKIPGGKLVMGGGAENEAYRTCTVNIRPFELGTKEVTFFEFDLFCAAASHRKPSDHGWGRGKRPVVDVDWYDAVEYCNWRSRQEGLQEVYKIDTSSGTPSDRDAGARKCWPVRFDETADGYRLPTEAEWEFAAGNGEKRTLYSWGDALPTAQTGGNVADETAQTKFPDWKIFQGYSDAFPYTAPAGTFQPNDFGLFDMTGNVWEWCWDGYDEDFCRSHKKKRNDPYNGCRVLRGGSWGSFQQDCYVRRRFYNTADSRNFSIGFRLARNQVNLTR
ncbi:MAG: hypothetical protein DYG98_25510 [Haliscomenobacteraceae bacterium CHB4]|nr:Hercynine oxygenase [Saprospiraceae bacterium]MCE7926417.1 hypothetical protein [Haliscomenobacteraceae bacterium CHB4]